MNHRTICWPAFCLVMCALAAAPVRGGQADVLAVKVQKEKEGVYAFIVTVQHADEGWSHYADRWEILAPDRSLLAVRRLRHPHTDEQPVTRELGAVSIPAGIDRVIVRAHDSRHGFGGKEVIAELPP